MTDHRHPAAEAPQHQREGSDNTQQNPFQQQDKPLPKEAQMLADKERANEMGHGPALSKDEQASLSGWRQFPENEHLRDLATKEARTMTGGPQLSAQEAADLYSNKRFPENEHLKGLAAKEVMHDHKAGPDLSPKEKADLYSATQFPNAYDKHYRDLAAKEIMADYGGPKMTDQESSELGGKRQFPHDSYMSNLATKENMSMHGGPKLTKSESNTLADARQANRHERSTLDFGDSPFQLVDRHTKAREQEMLDKLGK